MQENILLSTMTSREALMFSAKLKIKGDNKLLTNRVNQILEDFKLTKIADNLIGNYMIRGISGGEKKRLCIGIELISEPSTLILDEPTSGLDSVTAKILIKLLKAQAEKNKTIILTIHQPSVNIFKQFDRLILMVEGNFIYQGDAKVSATYFESLGYPCPELTNPPDHFMRVLYIKNRNMVEKEEEKKLELFTTRYKSRENSILKAINQKTMQSFEQFIKPFSPTYCTQMEVLLTRAFRNSIRNPLLLSIKLVQVIFSGMLVDILFHNLGRDKYGVQARQGVLFFTILQFIMLGLLSNAVTFNIERPLWNNVLLFIKNCIRVANSDDIYKFVCFNHLFRCWIESKLG
jgi:ATP-binding cassette, subfamily G (WHITE), eye pigment precursor transporter